MTLSEKLEKFVNEFETPEGGLPECDKRLAVMFMHEGARIALQEILAREFYTFSGQLVIPSSEIDTFFRELKEARGEELEQGGKP